MTVGMKTIARIGKIQARAEKLGFRFAEDRFATRDEIALAVIEEVLPPYCEGAVIFAGDLEEVESFIAGIEWARDYDLALGLKTDVRRKRSEQKVRNRKLTNMIKRSGNEDIPF